MFKFYTFAGKEAGFTLIELLVVITLIGLLSGTIISAAIPVQLFGRNNQRKSDLSKVQSALESYHADLGYYPKGGLQLFQTLGFPDNGFSSEVRDSSHPSIPTALTNCVGTGANCTNPTKSYLDIFPNDPTFSYWADDRHYCYTAYKSAASAGTTVDRPNTDCTNTAGNYCQYYELSATLEPDTAPIMTHQCDSGTHKGNYVVTPQGQLTIP